MRRLYRPPRRAHREFVNRTLMAPEALRHDYAQTVSRLRMRHPSLKSDLPVPTD